jgi:hypothetical protein
MKVSWDQFIICKCTLDLRTLTKDQKKVIWIKLIRGLSVFGNNIPKHNIYEFFEGLSRGTGGENPSQISDVYAKSIIEMFEAEECLSEKPLYFDATKIIEIIKQEKVHVEVFNQLWK